MTTSKSKIVRDPKTNEIEPLKYPGRPTKYRPDHCDTLLNHSRAGNSFESFAAQILVSVDTLYEWTRQHKEFSEARKIAKALQQKWWEDVGKGGVAGKIQGFNASAWIFTMKNRCGYKDNPEPTGEEVESLEFV